eukprot:749301-Hanusia_phi.AAC.4
MVMCSDCLMFDRYWMTACCPEASGWSTSSASSFCRHLRRYDGPGSQNELLESAAQLLPGLLEGHEGLGDNKGTEQIIRLRRDVDDAHTSPCLHQLGSAVKAPTAGVRLKTRRASMASSAANPQAVPCT